MEKLSSRELVAIEGGSAALAEAWDGGDGSWQSELWDACASGASGLRIPVGHGCLLWAAAVIGRVPFADRSGFQRRMTLRAALLAGGGSGVLGGYASKAQECAVSRGLF